jgi:CBS domain-containing protein
MHRIRSVLQRMHLTSASPDATVYDVAQQMTHHQVGAIPILTGDELVGIFSERDLMQRVVVPGREPSATAVGEVMTREVITANPEDSVDFCLEKMRKGGYRHLPVIVGGRVISMVSMRDLLDDELHEQEAEIRNLRAYLHQMPGN